MTTIPTKEEREKALDILAWHLGSPRLDAEAVKTIRLAIERIKELEAQRDELLNLVEESIEEHEQLNDCTGPGEKCMWCQRAAKAIALAKGTK
jgi:bacterioferritin-associated ferredoxin